MQYALLIYEDEQVTEKNEGGAVFQDLVRRHMAFSPTLRERGVQVGGAGLKGTTTATTVRARPGGGPDAGRTLHDGPFAETKEQLGGFYLIDVPDLDAAIEVARRIPLADGGAIEIRPVLGPG